MGPCLGACRMFFVGGGEISRVTGMLSDCMFPRTPPHHVFQVEILGLWIPAWPSKPV